MQSVLCGPLGASGEGMPPPHRGRKINEAQIVSRTAH